MQRFQQIRKFFILCAVFFGLYSVGVLQPCFAQEGGPGKEQQHVAGDVNPQTAVLLEAFDGIPSFVGDNIQHSSEQMANDMQAMASHIEHVAVHVFGEKRSRSMDASELQDALREADNVLAVDLLESAYCRRGIERLQVRDELEAMLQEEHDSYVTALLHKLLHKNRLAALIEALEVQVERRAMIDNNANANPPLGPVLATGAVPLAHLTWLQGQRDLFRSQSRFFNALYERRLYGNTAKESILMRQLEDIGTGDLTLDRRQVYRHMRELDNTFLPNRRSRFYGAVATRTMIPPYPRIIDRRIERASARLRAAMHERAQPLLAFIETNAPRDGMLATQAEILGESAKPIGDLPDGNLLDNFQHRRAESIIRSYEVEGVLRQVSAYLPREGLGQTVRERILPQLWHDHRALRHLAQGRMSIARGASHGLMVVGELGAIWWLFSLHNAAAEEARRWPVVRGMGHREFDSTHKAFKQHSDVNGADLSIELGKLTAAIDQLRPIVEERFGVRLPQVPDRMDVGQYLADIL